MIQKRNGSSTLFIVTQAAFLVGTVGLLITSNQQAKVASPLPEFRNEPLSVELRYNVPQVITDEQLLDVMYRLRPQLGTAKPKINFVDHALRCWGKDAQFNLDDSLSGQQMLDMLVDHNQFVAAWGTEVEPLLFYNDIGIDVRMQDGASTASHVDHTLGTLAEIGISLDHPLVTAQEKTNVKALLEQALLSFRVNQNEYEWTAVAAALYATGPTHWTSQDGERVTFDVMAQRMMREPWAEGVCFGNHRLYSLALLLQIDEQVTLFEDRASREEVIAYLAEATSRLVKSQNEQGYWDQNWYDAAQPVKESKLSGPQGRRVLATGHALEWWAIAPKEVQPPREVLIRAGQWLVAEITNMEPESLKKNYTFLTHVGRALCLWRGQFPEDIASKLEAPN